MSEPDELVEDTRTDWAEWDRMWRETMDALEEFGRSLQALDPNQCCEHRLPADHGPDGCTVPFCQCRASTEPF